MSKPTIGVIIFLVATVAFSVSLYPLIPYERPLTYEIVNVQNEYFTSHDEPVEVYGFFDSDDPAITWYAPGAESRYIYIHITIKNTDSVAGKFFIQLNSDDGIISSEYLYLNPNEAREIFYHKDSWVHFTSYDIIPDKTTTHLSLNEFLFDKTDNLSESNHYIAPEEVDMTKK